MSLTLGVHVGDKFYLNDVPVTVRSLSGYEAATVEVRGKIFRLTDKESVEIYPRVLVACGNPNGGKLDRFEALPRLLIDAPMSIIILREELYEKQRAAIGPQIPCPAPNS